ncbi:hypothetical protein TDB9533_01203 [Thalassocella blandensis]|nr:hypothetical protein TDB9533_01203 [Thalassocella blandensis]
MKYLLMIGLVLLSQHGFSTTWVEAKVDDPVKKGKKCRVSEPASYGGYIYQWPSKYDQVFWPFTDVNSIWFCKKSGFVSFMADFSEVNDEEINRIKEYLNSNRIKKPTTSQLVEMLEKINSLREFTPEYKNMLTRVYARWYQQLGDLKKAKEYRKQAFNQIKEFLTQEISQYKKLEYLYLSANYSRYLGEESASDRFIEKLQAEIVKIEDPELSGYGEYLSVLLQDTKYIVPGNRFDPVVPEEAM